MPTGFPKGWVIAKPAYHSIFHPFVSIMGKSQLSVAGKEYATYFSPIATFSVFFARTGRSV
jgi:hypothetical protein